MSTPLYPAGERVRALADGNEIPVLGLGVWQVPNGLECVNAVRWALELGYRHIDTAQAYGNEESVGRGIAQSGVPRSEVFITTKFDPSRHDPVAELEGSLGRLGVDYVDLYLVHWPRGGPTRAWAGMERARQLGQAKSIGVSNFGAEDLRQVSAAATSAPVVDQVQLSPFEYRRRLLDVAEDKGMAVEAYSPLGTGRHLGNETVKRIAAGAGRTAAQVLLRWALQHNLVVIPKSTRRPRLEENAQIFDFSLTDREMIELDGLDRTRGSEAALARKWW
jgi:diketogulonate reductase-like aldo/keto reductase